MPTPLPIQAVLIRAHGGPDVLAVEPVAQEPLLPSQVRVQVAWAGVNFVDTYQREGRYPGVSLPMRLGVEAAGVVVEANAQSLHPVGSRVACVAVQGCYATHVTSDGADWVRVPDGLSLKAAATAIQQGATADMLVHGVARIESAAHNPKRWAVVHAAAGGVGQWLVRMLRAQGVGILAVVSTPHKAALVASWGATPIDLSATPDWAAAALAASGGAAPQWVFDSVGAATIDASLAIAAPCGHVVLYGAASGVVPSIAVPVLMAKSLTVSRPRIGHYTATQAQLQDRAQRVFALAEQDPALTANTHDFSLHTAAQAHHTLADRSRTGKVLLGVDTQLD